MADRLRTFPRWLTGVLTAAVVVVGCIGDINGVPSSLLSSAYGAERPEAIADPLTTLLAEIVPDEGPARPPYQLARYDPGLKAEKDGQASMAHLRSQAVVRQKRLEELWHQVKRQPGQSLTPGQTAERKLLAYAFGEAQLDDAMTAARRAGTKSRYRLARLLLAECRFNEAVRELAALADGEAKDGEAKDGDAKDGDAAEIADRALALLVLHQQDREELEVLVPVLPLDFDLDGYLQRRAEKPAARRLIEGLRRTLTVELRTIVEEEILEEELELVDSPDGTSIHEYLRRLQRFRPGGLDEKLHELGQQHLVTTGNELVLYRPGQEWITGDRADLKLFSALNGPLHFRLYRFDDEADSEQVTAEKLARMKPERTWTQTYLPLSKNNLEEPQERDVIVEGLREGYYLLSVEARYAPMIAACPFRVSNVALYVRTGCNQGVVLAVDRRDGRPVPNLPLELSISGYPRVDAVIDRVRPAEERAFRDGFLNGQRDPDASDQTDTEAFMRTFEEILRQARAYVHGSEVRQQYPDFHQTRQLRTGADGSAGFALDLTRTDYRYDLLVERADKQLDAAALTRTRIEYQHPEAEPDRTKAVVWLAQPIHRPGSTVEFKGIVRRFDGLRVAVHQRGQPGEVEVVVRSPKETLWEGRCEVSAAGTFHGSFEIPLSAALGPCSFTVDGTGASPSTPLKVAEFRLPTYRVDFSLPSRTHAGGERVEARVAVEYFTGKPAVGAQVELVLETGDASPPTVTGLTDQEGRVGLSLPLPQVQEARYLEVRATVMDASGQTYSQSDKVSCSPSAFRVRVEPSKYSATHRESIEVKVRATTWEGDPVAGATVVLDGQRHSATTDETGTATFQVTTAAEGDRQPLHATVIADGKVVRDTSRSIGFGEPIPAEDPFGGPDVVEPTDDEPPPPPGLGYPEYPQYIDAGTPLEVTLKVEGPAERRSLVAVFAENTRMLHSQVLQLPPGDHRVTIPTQKDWAPSLNVTVVLLDGKQTHERRFHCYLRPTEQFLTLEIDIDKAEYKPGEPCTALITATDHEGRPVPRAEISLGVVDEAVYVLMEDPTPDLQSFFFEYRLPQLCRGNYDWPPPESEPLWFWLGPKYAWGCYPPVAYGEGKGEFLRRYGGTSASERSRPMQVRRDFRNTAFWVADLVTNGEGKARATFDLPDNLTQWRFTARGVTAETKVGEIRAGRRTFLPLQVELLLPRAFRAGDRIDLPVVLHNNTDQGREVAGTTRLNHGKLLPWGRRPLAAKADDRFTIPVTATAAGEMFVFASVRDAADGDADAIEKKLTVLPRGHRFTLSYCGPLSEAATVEPDLGGPLTEDGVTLTIRREPGLAGPVCSALEDLIQYPYGCVEQTMSRFMPAVVAGRAIRQAGLESPAAGRLDDVFAKGIARLADFQHDDGGWGWWKDDATNDFMTAYVLEGLALCRQLDHPVPSRMIDRAQSYLLGRLREGKLQGSRPHSVGEVNLRVYAAHALATLYQEDLQRYGQAVGELSSALRTAEADAPGGLLDRILLADAWRRLGNSHPGESLLVFLGETVAPEPGNRQSIFITAGLLQLAAALQSKDARWQELARELVSVRRGSSWGDTLTNSAAVRGLAAMLAASRGEEEVPVVVQVDGRRVGVLTREQGNVIVLKRDGVKRVALYPGLGGSDDFYSVRVEGFLESPPENPPEPAVTLRTRVFCVQGQLEEVAMDRAGRIAVPRGVTLEVRVDVELTRPVSHVRLTVPRPCGVELLRPPQVGSGVVATEERDDALHFFIEHWEQGSRQIRFPVRAEVSGTVFAPQPEFVPMYADSLPTAVAAPVQWVVAE